MPEAEPLPQDVPQDQLAPDSVPPTATEPLPQEPAALEPQPAPAPAVSPETAPAPSAAPATQIPGEHRWGRYSHQEVVAKAIAVRRSRVEKALDRIMTYVGKKGSISNDEVEKLDKVVDSTAALYLKQLVQRGPLRKTGVNRTTRYEKTD
jgi:3-oxoacyl-ACP reductase-like protein